MTTKKQINIREYRSNIAKLKKSGLIRQSIDARSHKPTRYMLEQIKRFEHIIDGTAIAVKTPKTKNAREFSGLADTKFNRVIVRVQDGERGRYTKSGIKINRKSSFSGLENTTELLMPRDPSYIPKLPNKKGRMFKYAIPFNRAGVIDRQFFSSQNMLLKFIADYEKIGANGKPRYEGIRSYIQIIEAKNGNDTGAAKTKTTKKSHNRSRRK